jgi:hypothetical protein
MVASAERLPAEVLLSVGPHTARDGSSPEREQSQMGAVTSEVAAKPASHIQHESCDSLLTTQCSVSHLPLVPLKSAPLCTAPSYCPTVLPRCTGGLHCPIVPPTVLPRCALPLRYPTELPHCTAQGGSGGAPGSADRMPACCHAGMWAGGQKVTRKTRSP